MRQFATRRAIPIISNRDTDTDTDTDTLTIGEFIFSRAVFHQILDYLDRGGMPGWRDGRRPEYVAATAEAVRRAGNWLFGRS